MKHLEKIFLAVIAVNSNPSAILDIKLCQQIILINIKFIDKQIIF